MVRCLSVFCPIHLPCSHSCGSAPVGSASIRYRSTAAWHSTAAESMGSATLSGDLGNTDLFCFVECSLYSLDFCVAHTKNILVTGYQH